MGKITDFTVLNEHKQIINPFKTDKASANGNLRLGNHKQSVTRTYHQDEPRKARRARQALDPRHSPQAPPQS